MFLVLTKARGNQKGNYWERKLLKLLEIIVEIIGVEIIELLGSE
jgi:hypothetical protein